jgi:hypothetical protein
MVDPNKKTRLAAAGCVISPLEKRSEANPSRRTMRVVMMVMMPSDGPPCHEAISITKAARRAPSMQMRGSGGPKRTRRKFKVRGRRLKASRSRDGA